MDQLTHENNAQALGEMRRGVAPEVLEDIGVKLVEATIEEPEDSSDESTATSTNTSPHFNPDSVGNVRYRHTRAGQRAADLPPKHIQDKLDEHRKI